MSKRIAILTGLLLAGIAGSLLWRASSGPREPVFEGRPLTSWLDHHVASSAANPPYGSPGWKKADEAIRHIGTNGIPRDEKLHLDLRGIKKLVTDAGSIRFHAEADDSHCDRFWAKALRQEAARPHEEEPWALVCD